MITTEINNIGLLSTDRILHKVEGLESNKSFCVEFFSVVEQMVGQSLYKKLFDVFNNYCAIIDSCLLINDTKKANAEEIEKYSAMLENYYSLQEKIKPLNEVLMNGDYHEDCEETAEKIKELCEQICDLAIEINTSLATTNDIENDIKNLKEKLKDCSAVVKSVYTELATNQNIKTRILNVRNEDFKNSCYKKFIVLLNGAMNEFDAKNLFDKLYSIIKDEMNGLVVISNSARKLVKLLDSGEYPDSLLLQNSNKEKLAIINISKRF